MKVLQINAVYGESSTGRTVKELGEELVNSGHTSIVVYAHGTEKKDAIKLDYKFEKKAHAFLARLFGLDSHFSVFSTKKIIKVILKNKPDIVHLRNLHANYVCLPKLLKFLSKHKVATVVSLHDCWFFTGKCTHYITAGCDKWKKGCYQCAQLKKDIPSWFLDKTNKLWKEKQKGFASIEKLAVIGVSDWITNEAKQSYLGNARIIKRIYNWIDLDVFYNRGNCRKEFSLPEDKFLILCAAARWDKNSIKIKDVLEIARNLDDSQRLVLVGEVDKSLTLPDNVIKLGYVNDTKALAKINSSCDVYVHISRADTFGKVIAEAMACGTPAVVYNTTACPEIVAENCGFVADVGNVAQVVNYIKEVQSKGKIFYLKNCISHVEKNFNKKKLVNDTINTYKELIDCREKD